MASLRTSCFWHNPMENGWKMLISGECTQHPNANHVREYELWNALHLVEIRKKSFCLLFPLFLGPTKFHLLIGEQNVPKTWTQQSVRTMCVNTHVNFQNPNLSSPINTCSWIAVCHKTGTTSVALCRCKYQISVNCFCGVMGVHLGFNQEIWVRTSVGVGFFSFPYPFHSKGHLVMLIKNYTKATGKFWAKTWSLKCIWKPLKPKNYEFKTPWWMGFFDS